MYPPQPRTCHSPNIYHFTGGSGSPSAESLTVRLRLESRLFPELFAFFAFFAVKKLPNPGLLRPGRELRPSLVSAQQPSPEHWEHRRARDCGPPGTRLATTNAGGDCVSHLVGAGVEGSDSTSRVTGPIVAPFSIGG